MKVDLFEIINIIMIFQLLVFTCFLWGKKKQLISNNIFGLHLFSQAAGIYQVLTFLQHDFFYHENPHLALIGYPFVFLWGPTFYLYVKSITYKDFRLGWKHVLHLIPFIFLMLFFAFTLYFQDAETKRKILSDPAYPFFYYYVVIDMALRLQILLYILKSCYILYSVRKNLKENYSSLFEMHVSWLTFVIVGYTVCYVISIAFIYTEFYLKDFNRLLYLGNFFQFFVYFNIIFFTAWNKPEIFKRVPEKEKYKSSKLTKEEALLCANKLEDCFVAAKPFLNPELTLNDLAKSINEQPRVLSQVINEHYKKNFFDVINHYRIEEAKKILQDPSSSKNVLEVLYGTGFNSKATFNRAFKKETGFTPTEFKKKFTVTDMINI
jgi:AraC-like DNA-binding protein